MASLLIPRRLLLPQKWMHELTELRCFTGIVNQLGKFSPQIALLSKPLRELLSTKRVWSWGPDQDVAYASGSLTDTEIHYAQIEKKALALT